MATAKTKKKITKKKTTAKPIEVKRDLTGKPLPPKPSASSAEWSAYSKEINKWDKQQAKKKLGGEPSTELIPGKKKDDGQPVFPKAVIDGELIKATSEVKVERETDWQTKAKTVKNRTRMMTTTVKGLLNQKALDFLQNHIGARVVVIIEPKQGQIPW